MAQRIVASGIGRTIDLQYRSNRIVVASTVLAGFFVTVWQFARGGEDPFVWGFRAAGAAFLGWAIAREIDPDDPSSATFAAQAGVLALVAGPPSLMGAAAVLLGARLMIRSTGYAPRPIDIPVLVGIAAWAAATGGWVAALAIPAALFADVLLDRRDHPAAAVSAVAGVLSTAAVFVAAGLADRLGRPAVEVAGAGIAVLVIGLLGAAVALVTRAPESMDDRNKRLLQQRRLFLARLLVVVVAVAAAAWEWTGGVARLGPAWGALVAVALRRPFFP